MHVCDDDLMIVVCLQFEEASPVRDCVLECGPDKTCYLDTCCARTSHGEASTDVTCGQETEPNLRQRPRCSTSEQTPPSVMVHDSVAGVPRWSFPVVETSEA